MRTGDELSADDIFGSEVDVRLSLVVTSATGVRRSATLGYLPPTGTRRRLSGTRRGLCATGCRLAALQLATAQGATIDGELELADLRVDGRPVDWVSSASDWNTTQDEDTLIEPVDGGGRGPSGFAIDASGFYPVEVSPAWVPARCRPC